MTQAEENALRIYIEKLEKQNALMLQFSTTSGFYEMYFNELKTAKSNVEAFNIVNERYFELFNKYRYADWNSFKVVTNYYHKKINK